MSEPKQKWTNDSLDKHLQERGFIKQPEPIYEGYDFKTWHYLRNFQSLYVNYSDHSEPELFDASDEMVDPMSIGYRNLEVQNDGSSDE